MIDHIITDYQFVISSVKLSSIPDSYCHYNFSGRNLYYDNRFSCLEIKNKELVVCGIVVGFIHLNDRPCFFHADGDIAIDSASEIEDKLLPALSGSFILLTFDALESRLYLDHGGSIPAVYDKETGNIGTTPLMILDQKNYERKFIPSIYEELVKKVKKGGWISGTLTAHQSVFRVLPNFFLDLNKLEQYRYWPKKNETTWIDFDLAVSTINSSLEDFTRAAINSFTVSHALTAGYDSRLLLSACRDFIDKCNFFTIVPCSSTDTLMARKISKKMNLNYKQIQRINSNYNDQEIWDKMVGHCVDESNREIFNSLKAIKFSNFIITGAYGEIGRCRFYRQDYKKVNELPINIDIIISRLKLPNCNKLIENIEQWLATLDGNCNSVIFDLAFNELKVASWGMGQNPIQNSLKFNLLPFAQRSIISSFLRVKPEEKTTDRLFYECIKSAWPEIAEVPINKGGFASSFKDLSQKITSLNRIKRYFRDKLARYI